MVVVYMRHGHDEYTEVTHRHDHRLTGTGWREAKAKARELVKRYGWPTKIYCSPFLRTKSTVMAMNKVLKAMRKDPNSPHYGKPKPDLRYDRRLSRRFSRDEQDDPSMFPETAKHQIPVVEDWNEFLGRIKRHVDSMRNRNYYRSSKVVWCVTHAIVYKRIAHLRGRKEPRRIDFLRSFQA